MLYVRCVSSIFISCIYIFTVANINIKPIAYCSYGQICRQDLYGYAWRETKSLSLQFLQMHFKPTERLKRRKKCNETKLSEKRCCDTDFILINILEDEDCL